MTRTLWPFLFAGPVWGHVMSMSSGDLAVDGARAHYELRMPLYEIAHMRDAEHTLLDRIRFASAGRPAKLVRKDCRADSARDVYTCSADYQFDAPVESVEVECSFHAIAVPNHVHLLRATMAGKH